MTINELLKILRRAEPDARVYFAFLGYKGGAYSYSGDATLHIDNPGECTNTEISRVTVADREVLIHTEVEGGS